MFALVQPSGFEPQLTSKTRARRGFFHVWKADDHSLDRPHSAVGVAVLLDKPKAVVSILAVLIVLLDVLTVITPSAENR